MTSRSQRLVMWTLVWISLVVLSLPTLVVLGASVTSGNMMAFPLEGFSLQWYQKIALARDLRAALARARIVSLICTAVALPVGTLAGSACRAFG